ncbi:MAG: hypothetical protein RLZZ385_1927 [Pseudomonadota bacterium]|jgi:xanthine dehydrogenase YagS FAD-binding subunit
MKAIINRNATTLEEAVDLARQAREQNRSAAFSGGGTDLLQQVKEGTVAPNELINLRTVAGADAITGTAEGINIGGLTTLTTLAGDALLRDRYAVLAQAAASVGTPQIRNVGTLAGNVAQRPWCWYYRNGFPCFKAGGDQCFSVTGENGLHAIFGGGPSYIVHPSDLAPALMVLDAGFDIVGPQGRRRRMADEFFILPSQDPARENVLGDDELLGGVSIPALPDGARSAYHKVMDREAWTHAVVSVAAVLVMDGQRITRARIVLGGVAPIPWRVPAAEALLQGQVLDPGLAARAGAAAIAGAQPLARNAYKLPLTAAAVERTLLQLAAQQSA